VTEGLISGENPEGESAGEFSGVGGLIQPPPHNPNDDASEQLMIFYRNFWRGDSGTEET
jgi:hypothetical protein